MARSSHFFKRNQRCRFLCEISQFLHTQKGQTKHVCWLNLNRSCLWPRDMLLKPRPRDKGKPHDIHGTHSWSHSFIPRVRLEFSGRGDISLLLKFYIMEFNAKSYDFKTFHLKIISNLQKSCKNKNSTKHLYSFTVNSFTVNILFICITAQEHPSTLPPPNTNTNTYTHKYSCVCLCVCI